MHGENIASSQTKQTVSPFAGAQASVPTTHTGISYNLAKKSARTDVTRRHNREKSISPPHPLAACRYTQVRAGGVSWRRVASQPLSLRRFSGTYDADKFSFGARLLATRHEFAAGTKRLRRGKSISLTIFADDFPMYIGAL